MMLIHATSGYWGKSIVTLPRDLTRSEHQLHQIFRMGRYAIYQQHVTPNIKRYEVIIVRIRKEQNLFGTNMPSREIYPSSEEWGTWGWTCWDLTKAIIKLLEIKSHRDG